MFILNHNFSCHQQWGDDFFLVNSQDKKAGDAPQKLRKGSLFLGFEITF
jgi:hypothetical protein